MKIRRPLPAALLLIPMLALAIALPGCSSEPGFVGTYELDKDAVKAALSAELDAQKAAGGEAAEMAELGNAMLIGIIDAMDCTLVISADGSARMTMSAAGNTDEGTGTWKETPTGLTLTLASEGEDPVNGTVIIDGETLRLQPMEGDPSEMEMIFRKAPAT